MTLDSDDTLLPLARSVADGDDVRWELEETTRPELREKLTQLRRLAEIADSLRSVARDPASPAPTPKETDAGTAHTFRFGPLEVHERIGEGSFGEVYRAIEPRLSREVALKLRKVEGLATPRELLEEGRRLARVRHPNVLVVHGADVHDGRVGLWTELVHGETLDERLTSRGPCTVSEMIGLGVELSRALAAVHAAGLLHGDIKGANVLCSTDGRTLLADFGSGTDALASRRASLSAGSPLFMAPEVLEGDAQTAASDVYALGALLYRQVSGCDPIPAGSLDELIEKHRAGARVPLAVVKPEIPHAVADVVERMLHPDPDRRLAAAADVESAFLSAAREDSRERADDAHTARPHNLPVPVTSFVGRAREMRRVEELVETAPLITIHGAGGTGKTRLALEIGRRLAPDFSDGVWLVDLAPVASGVHVPQTVASTLNVPAGTDVSSRVVDFLSYRSLLLILDNCEHVIDGCVDLLEALLPACPRVRVLATSRELLGTHDEAGCSLSRLGLPDVDDTPESIAGCESVMLFVERARTVQAGFSIDASSAPLVADICRRLDGIALAIELAAALLGGMSLAEVHGALVKREGLLSARSRAARPRHRTLTALIDWSFELLGPVQQMLLRRLSVFAGGWTLEAAERVCTGEDLDPSDVLSLLEESRRKSLVELELRASGSRGKRYRLLEPIREYLADRVAADERRSLVARHRDHYVAHAERAAPHLDGPEQVAWLERLEADHNNVRAAFDACDDETCDPDVGLRLAGAFSRFWEIRGFWDEGLTRLDRVLARSAREDGSPARARALSVAGSLARFSGRVTEARAYFEQSVAIARTLNDARLEASASNGLGIVADKLGDSKLAQSHLEHALALTSKPEDRSYRCAFLITLAAIRYRLGAIDAAAALLEEAIATARETRRTYMLAMALDNYGALLEKQGRYAEGEPVAREALQLMRDLGDPRGLATCSNNLGILLHNLGRPEEARELMAESLRLKYRIGNRLGIAYSLETFAPLAAERGDHAHAVKLAAAAAGIRHTIAEPSPDWEAIDKVLLAAKQALGTDRYDECWAQGAALPLGEVVELALR